MATPSDISVGLAHELSITATKVGWEPKDFSDLAHSEDKARHVLSYLRGLSEIKPINRVVPITRGRFNPAKFTGKDWSIIADETDARSVALTELDLTKVHLVTMLADGEARINGEEKLKRLKVSGYIRLDADIFLTFWENQHLIPESWKEKVNGNIRYIYFDGTVLRGSDGLRFVLYLYWDGGAWHWNVNWLGNDWSGRDPSAVLAR